MPDLSTQDTAHAPHFEEYAIPADSPADFAVRLTGDEMEPWLHAGDILLAERRIDLQDGDVGIFLTESGLVFRQVCRDHAGNLYLLSLDRTRSSEDIIVPASAARPVTCYGRVLLQQNIPLPTD